MQLVYLLVVNFPHDFFDIYLKNLGEMIQFDYFSDELKPPTRNIEVYYMSKKGIFVGR